MRTITCKPVIGGERVALTREVREILNVKLGDFVQFVDTGDGNILLCKVDAPKASA